jgi:hypothetical protein
MAVRSALTFAAVKRIGLALPGVEEGTAYGSPALKLRGQLLACIPTNRGAEPDSFVVRVDFAQRDELIASEPDVYYVKPHYEDYPCVLVRLKKVHLDAMRDLLGMGWRFVNSKAPRRRPRPASAAKRAPLRRR